MDIACFKKTLRDMHMKGFKVINTDKAGGLTLRRIICSRFPFSVKVIILVFVLVLFWLPTWESNNTPLLFKCHAEFTSLYNKETKYHVFATNHADAHLWALEVFNNRR